LQRLQATSLQACADAELGGTQAHGHLLPNPPPNPAPCTCTCSFPWCPQALQGQARAKDRELAAAGTKLDKAAATEERNRQLENSVAHLARQLEEAGAREKALLQVRSAARGAGAVQAVARRCWACKVPRRGRCTTPACLVRAGLQAGAAWALALIELWSCAATPTQVERQGDGETVRLQREVGLGDAAGSPMPMLSGCAGSWGLRAGPQQARVLWPCLLCLACCGLASCGLA
jgi:hypothetical protein